MDFRDYFYACIRYEEGYRLNAYPDGNGYSVGYGFAYYAPQGVMYNKYGRFRCQKGDSCTKAEAEAELVAQAIKYFGVVTNVVNHNISEDYQMAALMSLAYNIGEGNFATSSLVRRINQTGDFINSVYLFVLQIGNKNRRQREGDMFVGATPLAYNVGSAAATTTTAGMPIFIGLGAAFLIGKFLKNNL